jgi:hypothetical protein
MAARRSARIHAPACPRTCAGPLGPPFGPSLAPTGPWGPGTSWGGWALPAAALTGRCAWELQQVGRVSVCGERGEAGGGAGIREGAAGWGVVGGGGAGK